MKLSLFMNVLLVSSLAFVAIGCGKDKKKKSNDPYYGFYNPYTGGQTVNGQAAKDNLNSYVNAVEPKFIYNSIVVKKKRFSCTTKELLGIDFLPYQKCSESNLPDGGGYSYQGQTRLQINATLGSLLTPVGYNLGNVYQQGQYIIIDHVSLNGYDTIQYVIDTNQHASVNPIQVKNTAAQQIDYVYSSNI